MRRIHRWRRVIVITSEADARKAPQEFLRNIHAPCRSTGPPFVIMVEPGKSEARERRFLAEAREERRSDAVHAADL
jgi:hypothetical protein